MSEPVAGPGQHVAAAPGLGPVLECLLFVAADPVTPRQVSDALGIEEERAAAALEEFRRAYANGGGLQVVRVAGGYQLRTRPEFADAVAAFLRPTAARLSRQALETLAIVAYEQPVTQPEIDQLRGVNSSAVLKTLAERGLICEAGRKEGPGRPVLYRTTEFFLRHFGLAGLEELPRMEMAGEREGEREELEI